jgi:hypothetical protein
MSRKHKTRKHRGGYYGFSGAVGTGAPMWKRSSEMGAWASDISSRGGNGKVHYGSGRTRKGKRSTRRKMRGGGKFGGVSASFQGSGSRGLADYQGVLTRTPVGTAAHGAFNDMATRAYQSGTSYVRN